MMVLAIGSAAIFVIGASIPGAEVERLSVRGTISRAAQKSEPEAEPDVKSDGKAEAEPQAKREAKAEAKPKVDPEAKPKAKADAEETAGADAKPAAKHHAKPEVAESAEAVTGANALKHDSKAAPKDAETPAPEPAPEAAPAPAPKPAPKPQPKPEAKQPAGTTAQVVKEEEDKQEENGCAASGESCLKAKCCREPGMQCYTKDAWWGQCMASCTPGPNLQDQASPAPWACEKLGPRTPGEAKECSADGEDCRESKCCKTGGRTCFRKNEFWATCRPECTPGPNLMEDESSPWSCEQLGPRTMGAAPWVKEKCARDGEKCQDKGCCAEAGFTCYSQTQYYSKCRPWCNAGEQDNSWTPAWECKELSARTPEFEGDAPPKGVVKPWVVDKCSGLGENCLESQCCHAVNHQCFTKNEYWANCREDCSTDPDPNDGNATWDCKPLGPRSWGLALKGYPSLYCFSLFMPSRYEGPLLKAHLNEGAGIFSCDGYDVYAAEECDLGKSKDGIEVKAILIPKIPVGVSQDGTAGNAKLFMAVWDKVIAGARFHDYDFTLKVDPDAVLIPWRIRDHMRSHIGENAYVVNCNKFPNSPNFPMMFGAVEIFTTKAMIAYAMGSWKCGQQLPWGSWGEDYYMTHCLDFLGVGRIADFGVLGDNVCTGANCLDPYTGSFHPFKTIDSWMQCWGQATIKPTTAAPLPAPAR